MIEIIVSSVVGATVFAVSITAMIQVFTNRQSRKNTEKTRISITQSERDEIEQNEAWWVQSFHNLLLKSGAPVSKRIPGDPYHVARRGYVDWVVPTDRVALEGCICPTCENIMSAVIPDPAQVLHVQKGYVIQADGNVGPATVRALSSSRITADYISADSISTDYLWSRCDFIWHSLKSNRCELPKGHTAPHRDGDSWIYHNTQTHQHRQA